MTETAPADTAPSLRSRRPDLFVAAYLRRLVSGDVTVVDEAVHCDARMTWVKDGVHPMPPSVLKETIVEVFGWGSGGSFDGDICVRTVIEDDVAAILLARFEEPNHGVCFEVAFGLGRMTEGWRIANTLARAIPDMAHGSSPSSSAPDDPWTVFKARAA